MNIELNKYTGKNINPNVSKVNEELKYAVKDHLCERVHNNLKSNKDKKLI